MITRRTTMSAQTTPITERQLDLITARITMPMA